MDKRLRLCDILSIEANDTLPDDVQVFIADDIQYNVDIDESIDPHETLPGEHYGLVAPPYYHFWVEARSDPSFIRDVPHDDRLLTCITGAVVVVHDYDEIALQIESHPNFDLIGDYDWRWVYFMRSYRFELFERRGKHLYFSFHTTILTVDSEGYAHFKEGLPLSLIGFTESEVIRNKQTMDKHNALNPHVYHHAIPAEFCNSVVPITLRTINALHRKADVIEIEQPRNFRRYVERKYDVTPRNNYYLKVGNIPKRDYPQAEQAIRTIGKKKRSHYRIGHFKYYSEDKPHVSGLTGMMWVRSTQVHGDSEIEKRYQVTD